MAFSLWLACHTQEEIAAAVDMDRSAISKMEDEFVKISAVDNFTNSQDFDIPIYNVWKQQSKTPPPPHSIPALPNPRYSAFQIRVFAMHDYTATGPALGRKLKLIGGLAEQGFLPAEYGRRITAFLDTIEERKRLHDAYRALANLLDPESDRPWATAEKIYQQLEAFEKTPGYLRISRGYRQPKTTTEKWLVDALPLRGVRTIYRALTTDI